MEKLSFFFPVQSGDKTASCLAYCANKSYKMYATLF